MNDSQRPSRIAPRTLAVAAFASAGATFILGRFGLVGTLVGAALLPILVALIEEVTHRPVERVGKVRQAARRTRAQQQASRRGEATAVRAYRARRSWARTLAGVSWQRVAVTGAAAFLLVVGAFTVAELAIGDSVASDRRTTFFSPRAEAPRERPAEERRKQPAQEETTPTETTPEEEQPEEETVPPTETEPTTTATTEEETQPTTTAP